jgi:hypothetical protein
MIDTHFNQNLLNQIMDRKGYFLKILLLRKNLDHDLFITGKNSKLYIVFNLDHQLHTWSS